MQSILVTGGAGFIGANFVHFLSAETDVQIINLDRLTYAGNPDNLAPFRGNARHVFVEGDIGDRDLVRRLLGDYRVDAVLNFTAESHFLQVSTDVARSLRSSTPRHQRLYSDIASYRTHLCHF